MAMAPNIKVCLFDQTVGTLWLRAGRLSFQYGPDWLAQPNVIAVGGSWLAPVEEIRRKEWKRIGDRARAAVARYIAHRRVG